MSRIPKIGELFISISANNSKLRANLAEASSLIRDWSLMVTGLTAGVTNAFKMIASVGIAGIKAGITGLIAVFGLTSKVTADFEDSIVRAFTVLRLNSGATQKDFKAIRDAALEMGKETLFSAKQAADGMLILSRSGLNTKEVVDSIKPSIDLAVAGNIELAESALLVTRTMKQFGLESSQATRIADVLALTTAKTNTDISQLGAGMTLVGTIASEAGLSLEQTAASMGLIADAGIVSTRSGTGLRQAISKMISPTGRAGKIFAELGIKLTKSNGQMKDFAKILDELKGKGIDITNTMDVFGRRAAGAMLSLLRVGGPELRKLTRELKNSEGAADDMSQTLRTTLKGRIRDLSASLGLFSIALNEEFQQPLADATYAVRNFINEIVAIGRATGAFKAMKEGAINAFSPISGLIKELSEDFLKFFRNLTPEDILIFFENLRIKIDAFISSITEGKLGKTIIEAFQTSLDITNSFINNLKIIAKYYDKIIPDSIEPAVTSTLLLSAAFTTLYGGLLNIVINIIAIGALIGVLKLKFIALGPIITAAFAGALTLLGAIAAAALIVAATIYTWKFSENWLADLGIVRTISAHIVVAFRSIAKSLELISLLTDSSKMGLNFKEWRKEVTKTKDELFLLIGAQKEILSPEEFTKKIAEQKAKAALGEAVTGTAGPAAKAAEEVSKGIKGTKEGRRVIDFQLGGKDVSLTGTTEELLQSLSQFTNNREEVDKIIVRVINDGIKNQNTLIGQLNTLKEQQAVTGEQLSKVSNKAIKPLINRVNTSPITAGMPGRGGK